MAELETSQFSNPAPIVDSSRIFIKGLPPTISEEEFRRHFSAKQPLTDAKLIAHRRIGYVGYSSPAAARQAVKYFDRSFIRLSKIGVELARPVRRPLGPPAPRRDEEDADPPSRRSTMPACPSRGACSGPRSTRPRLGLRETNPARPGAPGPGRGSARAPRRTTHG